MASATIHLQPGQFYFGQNGEQLRTLLGSCVAITLWHPRRKIGGMSHCLLPEGRPQETPTQRTNSVAKRKSAQRVLDGRYCDHAVDLFLHELRQRGANPKDFEVKLFGGGNMFPQISSNEHTVGLRNIAKTRELLNQHGFKIKAEHVGEYGHRTIILSLQSGDTWLRWRPLSA